MESRIKGGQWKQAIDAGVFRSVKIVVFRGVCKGLSDV